MSQKQQFWHIPSRTAQCQVLCLCMPQTICSSPSSDRVLYCWILIFIVRRWNILSPLGLRLRMMDLLGIFFITKFNPCSHVKKHFQNNKKQSEVDKSCRGLHCDITSLPLWKEDTLSEVQTCSSILLHCTIAVKFYDEEQHIYGISAPQKQTVCKRQISLSTDFITLSWLFSFRIISGAFSALNCIFIVWGLLIGWAY